MGLGNRTRLRIRYGIRYGIAKVGLEVARLEVKRRGLKRIGLLGTRVVMESRLYGVLDGVLDGVEVIVPVNNLMQVHEAYVATASAGVATQAHREVFLRAGTSLTRTRGCESILQARTDLAPVFGKGIDAGFDILDCAEAHASAIALAAMDGQDPGRRGSAASRRFAQRLCRSAIQADSRQCVDRSAAGRRRFRHSQRVPPEAKPASCRPRRCGDPPRRSRDFDGSVRSLDWGVRGRTRR